jgi:hypothetical protein
MFYEGWFLLISIYQIFMLTMLWGEFVFPVEKRQFLKYNP